MPDAPERILLRGLNRLGDAVMGTPAMQRLREARPHAHITLLTPEKLAGLWQDQPFLDDILMISPGQSVWHVSQKIRAGKFSAAIAFPNSMRSALELLLAGVPRRIGLGRPGRAFLLTQALPPRPGAVEMNKRSAGEVRALIADGAAPEAIPSSAHHVHNYLYLTAELGASLEPMPPRIVISEAQAAQCCAELGIESAASSRPWFGLNPGAEYGPAKRWPAERFAEAAVILQRETNCRWLIFGGAQDAAIAEKIAAEIRRAGPPDGVLNLAGKTGLRQLAGALKICRLVLTNDTGPMHLAAAVGAPVVAVFGSTSPEMTGPIFWPSAQIARKPVPCAPCFLRQCPIDLRCLNGIDTWAVVEAARRILQTGTV